MSYLTETECLHKNWNVDAPPSQMHTCIDCGYTKDIPLPIDSFYNRVQRVSLKPTVIKSISPETTTMRETIRAIAIGEERYVSHAHLKCTLETNNTTVRICGLRSNVQAMEKASNQTLDWVVTHHGKHNATVLRRQ